MTAARRAGNGAYLCEWRYPAGEATHSDEAILESIVTWCRETLGAVRRPWGIDGFDLAVAIAGEDGTPRSLSLRRLRPADLYHTETLNRLRGFLASHRGATPAAMSIAVALFSWGDAAHAALPPIA